MKNGVHWVTADLAAHATGLVVVPLYADDNADNQAWCIENSGARMLITDHLRFLARFQSLLTTLPQTVLVRGEAPSPAMGLDEWLPPTGEFAITDQPADGLARSEEHTSELQSLMRISYALFCL